MVSIAILVQFLFLVDAVYSFELMAGRNGWNRRLPDYRRFQASSADELSIGKSGPIIKLPIVQVFKSEELIGEFICGSDLAGAPQKLEVFLNGISKLDGGASGSSSCGSIDNIYSDEHFEDVLHRSDNYVIVKLYRQGCKKCEAFDPMYEKLSAAPQFDALRWYQVDVSYLDNYMKSLKKRLTGGTQDKIAG
jgi:thiol-disulfide isomerase/thioredoxin